MNDQLFIGILFTNIGKSLIFTSGIFGLIIDNLIIKWVSIILFVLINIYESIEMEKIIKNKEVKE